MSSHRLLIVSFVLALACGLTACGDAPPPPPAPPAPLVEPPPPAEPATPVSDTHAPADEALQKANADAARNAILEVLREPDVFARTAKLAKLLPTLGPDAATAVPDLLTDITLDLGSLEFILLTRFWASHDAEAAARWSLFQSPRARRSALMEYTVEVWAREDPASAAGAVASFLLLPAVHSEVAELALVRGWFDAGRPGLPEYIRGLPMGPSRQRAMAAFVRRLIGRDGPDAAIHWMESVPTDDKKFRLAALRQGGSELAMLYPTQAAAWCDRVCTEGDSVRTLVAQRWAARDGRAALEWLSRAPEGRDRMWAVKGAFRGFYRSDRPGFEAWLGEMQGKGGIPLWFQPALELYAGALAPTDAEAGLKWASLIEDAETRERSMVNVAQQWRRRDEAAADAWLAQSDLSEEARERVRNPQPGKQRVFPSPEEEEE